MAGWLLRAIVMENVAARRQGAMLDLPAAPQFRLEKEIKNVITVIAKTCHYWVGHIPRAQQQAIGELFLRMDAETPLLEPALWSGDPADPRCGGRTRRGDRARDRPPPRRRTSAGWLGVECESVRAAVWMMRALVASNVLARREGTALFVPVNPTTDPGGEPSGGGPRTRVPVCLGSRRALTLDVCGRGSSDPPTEARLPARPSGLVLRRRVSGVASTSQVETRRTSDDPAGHAGRPADEPPS